MARYVSNSRSKLATWEVPRLMLLCLLDFYSYVRQFVICDNTTTLELGVTFSNISSPLFLFWVVIALNAVSIVDIKGQKKHRASKEKQLFTLRLFRCCCPMFICKDKSYNGRAVLYTRCFNFLVSCIQIDVEILLALNRR